MNPFLLAPTEQIAGWKSLREEISHLDEKTALQKVADYWSYAPLMKMAYDPEEFSDWPSPWEMIHAGNWCSHSVAIGMEFTLRLSGWDSNRLSLLTIRDYDLSDQRMILKVDETTVLNYTVGMVEEYPNTHHDVLITIKNDGKHYFEVAK